MCGAGNTAPTEHKSNLAHGGEAYGLSEDLPASWTCLVLLGGVRSAPGTGEIAANRECAASRGVDWPARHDESGAGDYAAGD